jgi:hypothetical protein
MNPDGIVAAPIGGDARIASLSTDTQRDQMSRLDVLCVQCCAMCAAKQRIGSFHADGHQRAPKGTENIENTRSGRVRRQGFEPRTRGLRVHWKMFSG